MDVSDSPIVVRDAADLHTAHYDPSTQMLTVRSANGDELFSDRIQLITFAFLPSSFPATLILVDASHQLSLLNAADPGQFDPGILEVARFDGQLKISSFSSEILFAFISETMIHVYELVPPIHCLPIRRYRFSEPILWFDFSDAKSITCVSGTEPNLRLRWFSLSKLHEIRSTLIQLQTGVSFVDAAVSPADASRVALLFTDGHADVYCNRPVAERVGETPREVVGAKEIGWSRYGSAIEIVDSDDQVWRFQEIVPEQWETAPEFDW
jgi:hypothetical protein